MAPRYRYVVSRYNYVVPRYRSFQDKVYGVRDEIRLGILGNGVARDTE